MSQTKVGPKLPPMKPSIFVPMVGQYENIGDIILRRPLMDWLQRVGLRVNDFMESFFNRHPGAKQRLLSWYKKINGTQEDKPRMSPGTARLLVDYYADSGGTPSNGGL